MWRGEDEKPLNMLFVARLGVLRLTRKIALWLISVQNEGGIFISTQDTVIGLQALSTYEIWVREAVCINALCRFQSHIYHEV